MSQLTFRGAYIRFADLRDAKEGNLFARLHMTSEITEPIREAMQWGSLPQGYIGGELSGQINASHVVLSPNPPFNGNEIQFNVQDVGDFHTKVVNTKEGGKKTELRFIVRTPQPGIIGAVEAYKRAIGKTEANLQVAYNEQGGIVFDAVKKGKKEDEDGADENGDGDQTGFDFGCIACNNNIPFSDVDPTLHVTGRKCEKLKAETAVLTDTAAGSEELIPEVLVTDDGQETTLASARTMAGGTTAAAKKAKTKRVKA